VDLPPVQQVPPPAPAPAPAPDTTTKPPLHEQNWNGNEPKSKSLLSNALSSVLGLLTLQL
jgi:hypothetical protein